MQKPSMLPRLLPALLALMLLSACAMTRPAAREDVPERPDPRINPLTLEQHRQIEE